MGSNKPGMRLVEAAFTRGKGALFCLVLHVLGFSPHLKLFSRIFVFLLIHYLVLRQYFGAVNHGKNVIFVEFCVLNNFWHLQSH